MKVEEIFPEHILIIAEDHITSFERKIALGKAGHSFVRLDECEDYLRLWKSIKDKGGKGLNEFEQFEVEDAVAEGTYNALLGIKEDPEDDDD